MLSFNAKLGIFLCLAVCLLRGQQEWSYQGATGPSHWGEIKPEYAACKAGTEQSPVDVRKAQTADLPTIAFDYKSAPLRLINNGHTVQVNYAAGSSITVGGERYELRQLHFHHPSEERINGKSYDMVVHLVHANPKGELAVVAVLLRRGATNETIARIWAALPTATAIEREISGVRIDAAALLPPNRSYFGYRGSLTTPPCTEGVRWFILASPVQVSPEQVETFASLFGSNARPIQKLGTRAIQRSR
jgi:carbonic anhydrase